jgi:uncharacterized protein (TIGR02284 family)
MATMIGSIEEDVVELLNDLITLDLDAIEGYRSALDRLEDPALRTRLGACLADHRRHVDELTALVLAMGDQAPLHGGGKEMLTRGRVVLAARGGPSALLAALARTEEDTLAAYTRAAAFPTLSAPVQQLLVRLCAEEQRHRDGLAQQLAATPTPSR